MLQMEQNIFRQMYWLLLGNLKSSLAQEQSDRQKLVLENIFLWEEPKVYNMECYKNDIFKALLALYVLWVEKKVQCSLNKILISYVITKKVDKFK